ncbi:DUF4307 domain-containing protein [Corynebacterium godavarianum]|uniref:DUF4307 domain-containing protein n=1 Tax=Corynebacterium godavarianum TaxID=2054421 RepID=UPI001FCBBB69|nr:DUF4307 domain-containing protein [Corynebacterium godavarianum]
MSTTSNTPAAPGNGGTSRTRYGGGTGASASKLPGRIMAIAAVLLVGFAIFAVARVMSERSAQPVSADFISQEKVDDSTSRLWIDVTREDTDVPSYCIVTAVDYHHAEIGRREVVIPAGGEEMERLAVDMPVRGDLASGRVYGCSEKIPDYMDAESAYYAAR